MSHNSTDIYNVRLISNTKHKQPVSTNKNSIP